MEGPRRLIKLAKGMTFTEEGTGDIRQGKRGLGSHNNPSMTVLTVTAGIHWLLTLRRHPPLTEPWRKHPLEDRGVPHEEDSAQEGFKIHP